MEATEGGDVADALKYGSIMDAITRGTTDGLRLAVNVGAMLVVLVSLIALVNAMIGTHRGRRRSADVAAHHGLDVRAGRMADRRTVGGVDVRRGALLGTKLVLNELVAYIQLAAVPVTDLSAHSRHDPDVRAVRLRELRQPRASRWAAVGALVPERRVELFELAPKTLISGTIVNCITGAIVGLVYSPTGLKRARGIDRCAERRRRRRRDA